jgi:hypothetical protein
MVGMTALKCSPLYWYILSWSPLWPMEVSPRPLSLVKLLSACTLREDHRLRVFENRLLRRIFGPKRDEVTWVWRKLHNEELHDLCSSPSNIRIIKLRRMCPGHVARMGEKRNVYSLLLGKPEGKRPLGWPRHKWVDNIKMDILETGRVGVDRIGLVQDTYTRKALVKAVP